MAKTELEAAISEMIDAPGPYLLDVVVPQFFATCLMLCLKC